MRAFTIIEMLISLLILSLIAGGIFIVTNIAILSWESNRGTLELVQDVRQSMDGMTRESRQSKLSSITIDTNGSRLDFSIPNISHTISYYTLNNQLIREHPAGTTKVLANNISSLQFFLNSIALQIQIQGTKTIRNAPHSFSLMEEVKLRNE